MTEDGGSRMFGAHALRWRPRPERGAAVSLLHSFQCAPGGWSR